MGTPSETLKAIRELARLSFKMKILPSIPGGKPGAFREAWEMIPFGVDYEGINVEVHPEPTRIKGVVLLRLVGIAYNAAKKEIVTRDLGTTVCLPMRSN